MHFHKQELDTPGDTCVAHNTCLNCFHRKCITRVLENDNRCPMCRENN